MGTGSASQRWDRPYNVRSTLSYPRNGFGAVVTHLEILVDQVKFDEPITCKKKLQIANIINVFVVYNIHMRVSIVNDRVLILRQPLLLDNAFIEYVETKNIFYRFLKIKTFFLQSTNLGRAYVVSGGIGQRQIGVVIEAQLTLYFSYRASVFGY